MSFYEQIMKCPNCGKPSLAHSYTGCPRYQFADDQDICPECVIRGKINGKRTRPSKLESRYSKKVS